MSDEPEGRRSRQIGAITLIIVGSIFLLRNFELLGFGRHWWALFFLVPISALLIKLQQVRKANGGKVPPEARGQLIGLITLVTVMSIFLFGFSMGTMWPVFIIIGGLSLMFVSRHPR